MNEHIDVEALAQLSQIALRDDEKEGLSQDVAAILSLGGLLLEDGEGAVPEAAQSGSAYRADEPQASLSCDELLALAPTSCDGYVTVPRVISNEPRGGDGT